MNHQEYQLTDLLLALSLFVALLVTSSGQIPGM